MVNSILVLLGFYLPVGFGLSLASGDAETSPGGEILWGIVLFVAVPFQLAGIIWFILERHQDRVQARLFGLTVLLQLALLLYTLVSCIHYFLGTVSCQVYLIKDRLFLTLYLDSTLAHVLWRSSRRINLYGPRFRSVVQV